MPIVFLLPVAVLLWLLPMQLKGELPYRVATITYIENILMWSLAFVGFMGMSRRARWTRPIFVFMAIEILAYSTYSLWSGRIGLATFLTVLAGVCVFMPFTWIMSPPIRKRIEKAPE